MNSDPCSFFCRTVPCSIQQCWTRPPHQSKLHIRFCFVMGEGPGDEESESLGTRLGARLGGGGGEEGVFIW